MEYTTVIVPDCKTLRSTTLARLEAFRQAGGRVIFVGSVPTHVDAVASDRVQTLAEACEVIPFSRHAVLQALEPERVVEVRGRAASLPSTSCTSFGKTTAVNGCFYATSTASATESMSPSGMWSKSKGNGAPKSGIQ